MCGISGLVNFHSSLEPNLIGAMTDALRHRGPDDEGYLSVDTHDQMVSAVALSGSDSVPTNMPALTDFAARSNLYLGHRRLAILDLSPAGHQPMQYGGHLWITYNGEIYNYLELRQELQAEGYVFNTRTDTEVILAAYDCWGKECVTRFNGDWAFCILDTRQRELFLSRDRYGIKPLYFFHNTDYFAFASEIKSLLTLPFVPRLLNRENAFQYLTLHWKDHTEETLFADIGRLLPGHNMQVNLQTGNIKQWQYYSLAYCPELGEYDQRKAVACATQVREFLFDAVRLRLRADVPVGTCLSGGIDSSAIVAIMAKILGAEAHPIRQNTFTASFPGESIDESHFARLVVESTGATSHVVYPSRDGYWHALPKILYHQDEPFGGPSVYAQWEVMREAAKHVKVVLDGQAGDEVFAGYRDYRTSFLAHLLMERRLNSLAIEIWSAVKQTRGMKKKIEEIKALPFSALSMRWKQQIYSFWYAQDIRLAQQALRCNTQLALEDIGKKFTPHLNQLLFHYMTSYSLPYLLRGEDHNSMAHSIEARVPFTDYRLVDYVFSLPGIYKIHYGWTKWLLRLAIEDLLPPVITWRKDKIGFATPSWASRRDEWDAWMESTFPQTSMGKFLSRPWTTPARDEQKHIAA